ncbi:MAG: ATP-grasp domain-containing protein [Holophagales bacterium]|nr:ATP-grasp domain-containing protein [Holophagales bacterium]MYD23057.1 ATP-grasp domain-containing protein [Holophagales bacterium]MYI34378.1 ATP-grasp domain-containing protein [Holophagales bacterium]
MSDIPTSPLLEEARAYYKALLRPVFGGRRFLLPGNIAVGLGNVASELRGLGAERPFVVAGSRGTGTVPTEAEAALRVLDVRGADPLDHNRNVQRALAHLPSEVQDAIDAWDPDRSAKTLHTDPLAEPRPVAGRAAYAARPAAWTALEDKIVIDAFWDAVGVPRAPSRVVPAEYQALRVAADALDRGHGTVWAPDAREGTNAGAVALRWVRPGDDGRAASADLARIADRVRVMPFLEGIPASIHGVVFPDAVVVLRPVEMLVLRSADGDRLFYAGCSTWFDPRPEDRETMRELARSVGVALREHVGFRGSFGIDGVLAEEGFLPTELNPRLGAGVSTLAGALGDFPLVLLCLAIAEGEELDYRPELLERAVLETADNHRVCGGGRTTERTLTATGTFDLVADGDDYREATAGEEPEATLLFGPGPIGGFLRFTLNPDRNEPGPPSAPQAARAFRLADRRLGTEFGDLVAARSVRP